MQAQYAKIELSQAGLVGLRLKVARLNKRANTHDMNKLEVRIVREWTISTASNDNAPRYTVEIIGTVPVIDGWSLAARIEFNPMIGTIVRVAPGPYTNIDYAAYHTHDGSCEHCKTQRQRNNVYVLVNENGQHKVVGRNCLADFIRTGDAESFAQFAKLCENIAEWSSDDCEKEAYDNGYEGGRGVENLERYLAAAALVIRRLGWVSKTEALEKQLTPTVNDINTYLYGQGPDHDYFVARCALYPEVRDKELARKVIEWAKGLHSVQSEYLYTIHKIATAGCIDAGLRGYAASMIRAYQRETEERAKKSETIDFIGSVGERFTGLIVKVVRIRYIGGSYGVRTVVAMETILQNGKVAPITWFASGEHNYVEGNEYSLTATVKAHEENQQWGKQTVVTRAKLVVH